MLLPYPFPTDEGKGADELTVILTGGGIWEVAAM